MYLLKGTQSSFFVREPRASWILIVGLAAACRHLQFVRCLGTEKWTQPGL